MSWLTYFVSVFLWWFSQFVIVYFGVINGWYLWTYVLALLELRAEVRKSQWDPPFQPFASPFYPGIAIVVPAYNEAPTIVESLQSMLSLNYPEIEVVVVNDGSTDETLDRLIENFDLEPLETDIPFPVPSEEIHDVYRSGTEPELTVVDKDNGGKSDALNAGIWLTDMPLFCAVDSDTIIERDALLELVRPFLRRPTTTVASGGFLGIANASTIRDGIVEETAVPKTGLAGLQVVEYLRAFYSGRLGLNRINGLILISGAFGLFRTETVREVGGYEHDTVTEDFDIVIRLHRHLTDEDRPYSVDFVPEPMAWTEVPEDLSTLGRQRRRWYRGMLETLATHRGMLFDRTYGRIGNLVLPFYILVETLGPLVEGLGYLVILIAALFGLLNVEFLVVFFLLTTGFGILLSWFGVLSEVWSFNRYDSPWQVLRLLWYGVLENFGYRQWKALMAWHALVEYLRGVDSWGVMERSGFSDDD